LGNRENTSYLGLITDVYSKKIVIKILWQQKSCLNALKMTLKKENTHHSDRGLQYCSDDYQKLLKKYKIPYSMTQESDPYENAIAERINEILKQEYVIDKFNVDLNTRKTLVKQAVNVYNQ